MINVLFAAKAERFTEYQPALTQAFADAGLDVSLHIDHPPDIVDYIVYAPNSAVKDFTPYHRCKAVLNLWAGVENVVSNPTLKVPLCRMVDAGLTAGMVEWVTGHVLRHHLGMDQHIVNPGHVWDPTPAPLAKDRPVTILGMGALGAACAVALANLGFPVTGWARTRKLVPDVDVQTGPDGLARALDGAAIVVLLLPDTAATRHTIRAQTLAHCAKGVVIINPGRGPLIDDAALLQALDAGHVAHATLDVFTTEPLPRDHPFWRHPKVTVTPHIASATRADTSAQVIAENIKRCKSGQSLLHQVDRMTGY
ncbi:MAG: glyoxylate/hydroxypyruvate reductase A [Pseudomonadota bacterium]